MASLFQKISQWLPFGRVPEISSKELHQRLEKEVLQVLDVRTHHEWAQGHIPGAISVPITQLAGRLSGLPFDKMEPVAVICLSAHRSIPAVRVLTNEGYRNVSQLEGGMKVWNKFYKHELESISDLT